MRRQHSVELLQHLEDSALTVTVAERGGASLGSLTELDLHALPILRGRQHATILAWRSLAGKH